jgi:16S rRNA (guanine527-N7)-methyltransferase
MTSPLESADEFAGALMRSADQYGIHLTAQNIASLVKYYDLVMVWNPRLHLVAPCAPAEFATRHVLESLLALTYFPESARIVDAGSGAGLPLIPCWIVRPDLRITLIEASGKKAVFLREALGRLSPGSTTQVIAGRFEEIAAPVVDFVTCRALDRFAQKLPQLVAWSPPRSTLVLFGGPELQKVLEQLGIAPKVKPITGSERRFVFIVERNQ